MISTKVDTKIINSLSSIHIITEILNIRQYNLQKMLRYPIFFTQSSSSRRLFNVRKYKFSSIPASKKISEITFEKHINELEGLSTVFPKERVKLAQRPPFLKNLFIGIFDTELLTYPQLQKQDVEELEGVVQILQKVSNQHEKPKNINEVIQRLKDQRCLGLQCSIKEGGRELNQTEQSRYNEVLLDNDFKFSLISNEMCILGLSRFGTEEQKNFFLRKLLNGNISSTISTGESLEGKGNSKMIASISEDFKTYSLNGNKSFVVSGYESDFYIVFSQMNDSVKNSIHELDLTAFLVDSNTPGITVEKVGCKDPNLEGLSNLIFNNTQVPAENILGGVRDGRAILSCLLPERNINFGVINLKILKKLVTHISEEVLNKSIPNEELHKTEAITSKLGNILEYAYIVESMLYFTTGLMSTYENQDCELESLITKVLSSELAMNATEIGFSMSGPPSAKSNHFCQELHQEAVSQYILNEQEDIMRIFVALLGLQYSGKHLGGDIKKLRNPFFHGSFILKKMWQDRKHHNDNPKLTLGLKNYLHLSCQEGANQLEYCVLRLQYITETLFARYGIDILNKHNHLRRLANILMQIYAMIACLSRASRSYCIGLQHAEAEILMANIICKNGTAIVKKNVTDIICENEATDKSYEMLSENVFKLKEYYFAHPLCRNF